ncbi:peptidoglycan DD-metalloendopeptidase family protein [Pengzhenrongella sicca]|uniref:Peptidoglycan DD-metalloendopeptidase family protein n=1 Tax=Pengzhenrongella sicca TaxID=2819238 RepID=A0A8A4ZEN6_9MICO|nr:M23 family metallopeptidase [Pengzhenrongella sicca]QTE30364.1 peptidoglycan DD-metalloendopeptidase family protein [Pengzhenrongella sicca]
MRLHRTGHSRRSLVAGALATVLVALAAAAGPAFADDFDDQRAATEARAAAAAARAEELAASVEGLSAELGQAVLDLQATEARLPIAQAELATAQADLERTQREAALVTARLEDARSQESSITTTIEADGARAEEIRAAVGQMARRAYKGETAATSLSVVMDSTSTEDFVSQYGMVSTALRTQTKALDDLDQISATNKNSQARLAAIKVKVTELKAEADQKVVEADAAKAAAAARQAEIEQLIADQSARKAAIEAMRAQAESEQAQVDAERNTIASELADIIAKQRAAAEAARAAAQAAGKSAPAVAAPSGSVSGAIFGNPTSISPMHVTSEYGMRLHPTLGYVRLHAGIDLRTYCNTPEYAAADGTVQWAQNRFGFGNQVMIDHGTINGNSVMASYNHMTRFVVSGGQGVTKGQLIGYSGNTGTSAACHLHFEVYVNGSTVNPRPLLGL